MLHCDTMKDIVIEGLKGKDLMSLRINKKSRPLKFRYTPKLKGGNKIKSRVYSLLFSMSFRIKSFMYVCFFSCFCKCSHSSLSVG